VVENMAKQETFIVRVLEANRITIPMEYAEVLNLKKGQKVRITIEVVK
jgi:bifunctional DNA-binding transcriptional regulator/antitoxin component of YhaV-PrlF toxin-antitoxin module